ncbi:hypothetical protein, partial [Thiolapillus sp.]|uniref:hypothetical protein n=1 Tax=Thiolapillus sp. TaxID=2017437 RepID=UPI003AF463ED
YDTWKNWMLQFNHLYALLEDDVLPEEQLKALDLPEAIAAPQLPQDFYAQIISTAQACRYLVIDFGTSKSPYMVSSRFARLNNPNDRDKIASIYPACLRRM